MKMTREGFIEYKRREFCKDVQCPVQTQLNKLNEASLEYERLKHKCGSGCLYTTWQFHHWLIEKGYLILKPKDSTEK
jgi:acyl-CoA thioesterase FadM